MKRNSIILFASILVLLFFSSCGHGYGIKEGDGDHTSLSDSEVKSQQADIQFIHLFYDLYLNDKSTKTQTPEPVQFDSLGNPIASTISVPSKTAWEEMVASPLLNKIEGSDYDVFLAAQDYPDNLEVSVTPVQGRPGWYEVDYATFDGSIKTILLEVKMLNGTRKITSVD